MFSNVGGGFGELQKLQRPPVEKHASQEHASQEHAWWEHAAACSDGLTNDGNGEKHAKNESGGGKLSEYKTVDLWFQAGDDGKQD